MEGKYQEIRKYPVKHKKYKEDEKLRKRSAKKTKANAQMTAPQPNGENSSAVKNLQANTLSKYFKS